MNGVVRAAALPDLPALLDLEGCFPGDRLSRRSFVHLITKGRADILVFEADGAVRGYAIALYRSTSRRARIYSLAVHPLWRGRGIAQRLLERVEQRAGGRGCNALGLEVRADNPSALRLYLGSGFSVTEEVPGYYEDHAPALKMRRALGAPGNVLRAP